MTDYDPRGELAPRDVVAQAIVTQMEKTAHPCVYLDMTHLDPQFVKSRFPGIAAKCQEFGIDITTDLIPVRPGAHYMVGGVTVDAAGTHFAARVVGGGRSDVERSARSQSPGLQQPARGTRVRRPRRGMGPPRRPSGRTICSAPCRWRTGPWTNRAKRWIWPISATR